MSAEKLDLRSAEARCKAATPGPWGIEREELSADFFSDEEQEAAFPRTIGPIAYWEPHASDCSDEAIAQIEADAAFIANARTDLPAALALLREAVGLRRAWRDRGGVTDNEYGALAEAFWQKIDALDPEVAS